MGVKKQFVSSPKRFATLVKVMGLLWERNQNLVGHAMEKGKFNFVKDQKYERTNVKNVKGKEKKLKVNVVLVMEKE